VRNDSRERLVKEYAAAFILGKQLFGNWNLPGLNNTPEIRRQGIVSGNCSSVGAKGA
jgi:hypothetical protein